MSEPRFDRTRVEQFLQLAGDRLVGEWLLIGGAAAAAWFSPRRTTEDLDLIGMNGAGDRFSLMELALSVSLPVEAVNSAADFFVRRIAGWRDRLVPLHRGATATIYRPDATLFLLLKIGRLSEIDLGDCIALLDHCNHVGEVVEYEEVSRALDALPASDDGGLLARRDQLRASLAVKSSDL